MARKLVVDDGADDEMLAATIHGTKDVLKAADGHLIKSGAWWHGRAKIMKLAEKGKAGVAARKKMFKRLNTDGDDAISWEEALAAVKKMWPEFDNVDARCLSAPPPLTDKTVPVQY
jgi:hypothetical protein